MQDFEPEDHAEGPAIPDQVMYWVAIYLTTRQFGGPEEGGWYYDHHQIDTDPDLYRDVGGPPRAFFTREEADDYADGLRPRLEDLNRERPFSFRDRNGVHAVIVRPALLLEPEFPVSPPVWS